jgi:hypothetical protein
MLLEIKTAVCKKVRELYCYWTSSLGRSFEFVSRSSLGWTAVNQTHSLKLTRKWLNLNFLESVQYKLLCDCYVFFKLSLISTRKKSKLLYQSRIADDQFIWKMRYFYNLNADLSTVNAQKRGKWQAWWCVIETYWKETDKEITSRLCIT